MKDINLKGEKGRFELFCSFAFSCFICFVIIKNLMQVQSGLNGEWEILGYNLGMNLATPYLIVFALATAFNLIAFIKHSKPFTLTSAILYAVAIAMFPTGYRNTVSQAIICLIGYVRMQTIDEIIAQREYEDGE